MNIAIFTPVVGKSDKELWEVSSEFIEAFSRSVGSSDIINPSSKSCLSIGGCLRKIKDVSEKYDKIVYLEPWVVPFGGMDRKVIECLPSGCIAYCDISYDKDGWRYSVISTIKSFANKFDIQFSESELYSKSSCADSSVLIIDNEFLSSVEKFFDLNINRENGFSLITSSIFVYNSLFRVKMLPKNFDFIRKPDMSSYDVVRENRFVNYLDISPQKRVKVMKQDVDFYKNNNLCGYVSFQTSTVSSR